jgi:PAS domain S-box-containing protein
VSDLEEDWDLSKTSPASAFRQPEPGESSDVLRMALGSSELGIWDWYPAQNVLRWDARCKAIFGLPPDAPVDLDTFFRGIHPDDKPTWERVAGRALAPESGGQLALEYRVIGIRDKVLRWVATQGKCSFDAAGKPVRFIGTILDVTERKRAEEHLRKQAEFEQQLIGMVSHDLRSPLQAAMLGAQMLQRGSDLSLVQIRVAGRIVHSLDRASRLIRDLLDFTQVRLGSGLALFPAPADLAGLARTCIEEMKAGHPDCFLSLEVRGDTAGVWDGDRILQVISNLLGNALSYSPEGAEVSVVAEGREGEVSLRVHNGGPPIPEEALGQLFRPFLRGSSGVNREGRSIGLGLYIVEQLVAAHHGRVTVTSTAAEGTTFEVHLPRS